MTKRDSSPPGGLSSRVPWLGDASGAFGDLGTFLPLVIGLLVLGSYKPAGLLVGFGVFAIATGVFYRRPIPVQPMKAVAALAITGAISPAAVALSGLVIGGALVVLGAFRLIDRLERLVPRTVLLGIQLGLGVSLMMTSVSLLGGDLWLGLLVLAALAALQLTALRSASCLILLLGGVAWSLAAGATQLPTEAVGWHFPGLAMIQTSALSEALGSAVLPQLALTVTNAVLLTAALSADYFPQSRARVSTRNLALSSGLFNLLLAPFGAIPMCHGAGGLAAQYAQGARTGLAPVIFGATCLLLGVLTGPQALAWLSLVPMPVIAALLAYAGWQLADVNRLVGVRRDCLAIIAVTMAASVLVNPAVGLLAGVGAEQLRARLAALRQGS
jgi:MFS superfamily sulfate permease-like transporter